MLDSGLNCDYHDSSLSFYNIAQTLGIFDSQALFQAIDN